MFMGVHENIRGYISSDHLLSIDSPGFKWKLESFSNGTNKFGLGIEEESLFFCMFI